MFARTWLAQRFIRKPGTAEVRPVSRMSNSGAPLLEGVVLYREGKDERHRLRLTTDQAAVVHARLRQIKMAFQPETRQAEAPLHVAGVVAPEHDPVYQGDMHAVGVWPITQQIGEELPILVDVLIRADDHQLHLTPDELVYIDSRLTHLLVAFMHQNQWGGEDAHRQ